MSAHLTEEEQIEAFKRWWKENGTTTIAAVVIASAGYFGFGAYQSSQERVEQNTSAQYDALVSAVNAGGDAKPSDVQSAAITQAAETVLKEEQSGLYADLARFQLAKIAVDAGDLAKAETELRSVVANSETQASIELAKLRLARVKAALGNTEEALGLLASAPSDAFKASYAEARGDVLQSLGRTDEAYTAYEAANAQLEQQEGGAGMRGNILKFKMDNSRIASVTPVVPATAIKPVSPHGEASE